MRHFAVTCLAAGTANFVLHYKRGFESKAPAKTFSVTLVIS